MKKLILPSLLFCVSLSILLGSCFSSKTVVKPAPHPPSNPPVVVVEKKESHLPPGQAKKIYGEKSAKDFAPGQQKKRANYPLIIVFNTSMKVIVTEGRRCYKNEDEVVYWEGNDGRYYVDERFVPEEHDKKEYDDWNRNKGQSNKKGNGNGNENGNGNGKGKGKDKDKDKDDRK